MSKYTRKGRAALTEEHKRKYPGLAKLVDGGTISKQTAMDAARFYDDDEAAVEAKKAPPGQVLIYGESKLSVLPTGSIGLPSLKRMPDGKPIMIWLNKENAMRKDI